MESEGSGKRPADQLQGVAVQNKAVRTIAFGAEPGSGLKAVASTRYKVVIRFVDHAVRGYASSNDLGSVEQLLSNDAQHSLAFIRLTMIDTGEVKNIPISDAKAVFFVSTFDGDTLHQALHFHQNAPIQPGLWVRIRFQDGEEIEGFVSNTRDHVLGSGFFMMPTDPDGNNRLIYVLKSRLEDFNVLGIRNAIRVPVL